ncbi:MULTISPECIES: thiol-disulfide oxidoreductase DCC family protein [Pseudomonas]|uniref:thiol-disulfide oxidoreductase DCC family protein n=1 Tax=Pseudomonas TaxID=286 RepID=UPI001BD09CE1|nr:MULTISPECIES: DUF393 domain-containing protein [Pseudomonas]UXY52462.1 DUF393 domain-containing protein [Pseudomonas tohonis]BBP85741.1 thiol-disulfide oxidoreductase [Pseudomonas sp. Pc102]
MSEDEGRIKVYYNSACPVCRAGIEGQKDKSTACEIEWADVHADNQAVEEIGEALEYVRERLHLVDEQGVKRMGVDAFIVLWRHSPKERWKARLLSLPLIHGLAQLGYKAFARLLYLWNRSKRHW